MGNPFEKEQPIVAKIIHNNLKDKKKGDTFEMEVIGDVVRFRANLFFTAKRYGFKVRTKTNQGKFYVLVTEAPKDEK